MSKVTFTFDEDALEQHDRETRQALARELLEYVEWLRGREAPKVVLFEQLDQRLRKIAGEKEGG